MIFAHCALPPSHLDKIQKNSYFFRDTVPYLHKMFKMALRLIVMFLHDNDKSDNSTDQHNLSWMLGDCHMGGDEQACLSEQVHRIPHYNRHHNQIIIFSITISHCRQELDMFYQLRQGNKQMEKAPLGNNLRPRWR